MVGFLMILMSLVAIFLILLILVQRGRGGGLAGALGGMGGQSAFGTKAGDLFTKITIVAATVWILLAAVTVKYMGTAGDPLADAQIGPSTIPVTPPPAGASGATTPATKPADDGIAESDKATDKPVDSKPAPVTPSAETSTDKSTTVPPKSGDK